MTGETEKRVIRNRSDQIVASMEIKSGLLDGTCEWYDSRGGPVAFGHFVKGQPCTGTFINWALFFPPEPKTQPYDIEYYCRDWITIYESSFDSEAPQYINVLEVYSNGRQIREPDRSEPRLTDEGD